MCGHVGYVTAAKGFCEWDKSLDKFIQQGLYLDVFRGKDATGLAFLSSTVGRPEIIKKPMPAYDFLELSSVRDIFKTKMQPIWAIGHNRAATVGEKTAENAHPFQYGSVILAHNGTLPYGSKGKLVTPNKYKVDSMAIADAMSMYPAKDVLEDIDGAFALVWHDAFDNTINFARNEERPFYIATSSDDKAIAWASDRAMLAFLCNYNGMLVKDGKLIELPVGVHMSIDYSELKLSVKEEKFTPVKKYQTTGAGSTTYTTTNAPKIPKGLRENKKLYLKLSDYKENVHAQIKSFNVYWEIADANLYPHLELDIVSWSVPEATLNTLLDDVQKGYIVQGNISTSYNSNMNGRKSIKVNISKDGLTTLPVRIKEKKQQQLILASQNGQTLYPLSSTRSVNYHRASEILAHGCSNCTSNLTTEDWLEGKVCFSDDFPGEPFCPECAEDYRAFSPIII